MEVAGLSAEAFMVCDHARLHREEVPMFSPCDDMANPMLQVMFDGHGLLLTGKLRFCDENPPPKAANFLCDFRLYFAIL